MLLCQPKSTRTYTLCPYTRLFRSPDRIGKDIESPRLHQHRGVTNPDGLHLSGLHVHLRLRWLHCHIFGPFRPLVRAQEPAGKHTSPAAALGHGTVLAAIRVEKALSIIVGTERPFVVDAIEERRHQNSGKAERHHGEEQECACNLEESTNYAQHSISAFRYGSAIAICGYTARAMALTHARSAGIGAIMLYALLRPLLFRLDGETAHRLTVKAMTLLPSGKPDAEDAALASTVAGLRFPNPVGDRKS